MRRRRHGRAMHRAIRRHRTRVGDALAYANQAPMDAAGWTIIDENVRRGSGIPVPPEVVESMVRSAARGPAPTRETL